MANTTSESHFSRIIRLMIRISYRIASFLAILVGFSLLFTPFVDVLDPETSLLALKFVSVMGGSVMTIVLGLALMLLGTWLRSRVMNLQQAENDRTAQWIMNQLRSDPETPPIKEFYLYLRAFETTGRLRVPLYLRLRKISIGLNQLVTNDVESYVSNSIRSVAPLIALGQPGENIGAGRILTEDEKWMADIVILMKRARGILIVPSNRPGTLWEIETLKREGLLNKVVFIMPPHTKGELDTKQRWESARQALISQGLDAPEHQDLGLLFKVGSEGKVSNVEPFLFNSIRQVRKSLQRILSEDSPKAGLFKAIVIADKRTRRAAFWGRIETMRQLSPYVIAVMGLLLSRPDDGFDPSEAWATVLDRTMTARAISRYELVEIIELTKSEKYQMIKAQIPEDKLEEMRVGLLMRGLFRLDNDKVKAFFMAWGDMLARVDTNKCAAIGRGDIQPDVLKIALTYIPPNRIDNFLRARTAAILAEVENLPVPSLDEAVVEQATQQFMASLSPEDQQRYNHQTERKLSNDDQCWIARITFDRVGTLAEPYGSVWARVLVALAISTDNSIESEHAPENATP